MSVCVISAAENMWTLNVEEQRVVEPNSDM